MTSTPAPDPTAPPSPRDLSRIVDELEERTAAEVARERRPEDALPQDGLPGGSGVAGSRAEDALADEGGGADTGGGDDNVAREVPGALEPPD